MKSEIHLFLFSFVVLLFPMVGTGQTTVVTDSATYNPESTAILDVQSVHKGFLAPRMSSSQRLGIITPAEGLLVFDTTEKQYYVFQNGTWSPIDNPAIWKTSNDDVFVTGDGLKVGVGTSAPLARLSVVGDATAGEDEPLFEVKNSDGKSIFAVYEDEVKVNFIEGAKANKGGFAVGGLTPGKADPTEYLRITPDSVRVWIDDSGGKAAKGGFAVGGLTPAKGAPNQYLTIEKDSARIYVDNSAKGAKGGFAVGGLTPGKGNAVNFLDLTPENYFIGDSAGLNNDIGVYNTFIGHQSGLSNLEGNQNIFIGYKTGHTNTAGQYNTFLGVEAGFSNTGSDNTFIGFNAGRAHQSRGGNVYLGSKAGDSATMGEQNVYIGESAGSQTTYAKKNVFIGFQAGYNTSGNQYTDYRGSYNVFVGNMAGHTNTTGRDNVFLGNEAGFSNSYGEYNVYLGYKAGYSCNADDNIFIGHLSGYNFAGGDRNVYIGKDAGYDATGTHYNTVAIGEASGYSNQASNSIFIGMSSGKLTTTGGHNTFIGHVAGQHNTTGDYNTFLGAWTGSAFTDGIRNVYLGPYAGAGNSDSVSNNIFIGFQAGYNCHESNRLYIESSSNPSPLIYGEFDTDYLQINGTLNVNGQYDLPTTNGVNGQVLLTDGSGGTSWATLATGGVTANNGNSISGSTIQLGATTSTGNPLVHTSYVNLAGYNMIFNMNGNGDFEVRDNNATAFFISDEGNIGLRTNAPAANMHIIGDATLGQVIIAPNEDGSEYDSELVLAEDDDYTYGMSLKYDGGTNKLGVYGKSSSTTYGPHITINRNDGDISFKGGIHKNITTLTADYTILDDDGYYTILVNSNRLETITLPTASANTGREIIIKRIGIGSVIVACEGTETLDGDTSKTIDAQYKGYKVQSSGSNWYVIGVIDTVFK